MRQFFTIIAFGLAVVTFLSQLEDRADRQEAALPIIHAKTLIAGQ